MLVHPWDAPQDDDEWRGFLLERDFGQLIAPGRDRDLPIVVPTHFLYDGGDTVLLHLARPNPVWEPLTERPRAVLSVIGDYVYVPARWNANPGSDPAYGVPTSYYATVQVACDVRIIDEPEEKAALLTRQLAHFEPPGAAAREPVSTANDSDRRQLPGIRGIELTVTGVRAKFKYGGNKQLGHRTTIAGRLEGRDGPMDAAARDHLLRRSGQL